MGGCALSQAVAWLISGPLLYVAVVIFIAATVRKMLFIARLPRHLRWDLYPIAHEPHGSRYEQADYWQRLPEKSLAGELAYMLPEMLLLKKTFLYNRGLWYFSFAMHLGFYLLMGWLAALVAGALTELAGVPVTVVGWWPALLYYGTILLGAAGLSLGFLGTAGLLYKRVTDAGLREFSAPVTHLNLWLFLALFGAGGLAWLQADPTFHITRQYVLSLITMRPLVLANLWMLAEVLLFSLFLMYLPCSRMLHFLAKYFFYHNIMWDDESVVKGGALEQDILAYLRYQPGWAAPHITPHADWLTQAATNPTAGVKKHEA